VWKLKQKLPQLTGLGVASEKGELEEQDISVAAHSEARALAARKKKTKGKPAAAKRRKL
jgi:hypothetical protein